MQSNDWLLKNVSYVITTSQKEKWPVSDKSEVLLIGRSNVGKSTFINGITNNRKLAHISSKPGKTRALSWFDVNNDFFIVDAPGYGYAKVSRDQKERHIKMMGEYFTGRENLKLVCLLVDLRREALSEDDEMMIRALRKNKVPFIFLGTKMDKLNQKQLNAVEKLFSENKLTRDFELIKTSAVTKKGYKLVIKRFYQLTA